MVIDSRVYKSCKCGDIFTVRDGRVPVRRRRLTGPPAIAINPPESYSQEWFMRGLRVWLSGRVIDMASVNLTTLNALFNRLERGFVYPNTGIITVLDSKYAQKNITEKKPESVVNEAVRQVALADLLILNKIDLVDAAQKQVVTQLVRTINSSAEVIQTERCRVDLDKILDLHAYDSFTADSYERTLHSRFVEDLPHLDQKVRTVTVEVEGSMTEDAVDNLVEALLWERTVTSSTGSQVNIYRMKGILSVVGEKTPVMLQAVQELYETEPAGSWPDGCTRSCKLVLIGENLEEERIRNYLKSLVATTPALL
ncbi:putative COBW domain-containing protein 7 [Penaeus vannamei]|uniref:putative COBW domain-containing protein 7 n=1 Tax=Penaeus vannamei TaxID=6689 RepID=UPI00387F9067